MMANILVVGATSFSGKAFCRFAEAKGALVTQASLREPLRALAPDYVVNFAALNVVAPSWDFPGKYVDANVNATITLFDWIRHAAPDLQKLVHVSTPEVYGSTAGPITEAAPFNPSTPYAVSRAAAEMMARCYHKQYGLPVVFTRGCNVYGPGQQIYRLIPNLIVSILKGQKFKLEGAGASRRSFVYVDDLAAAIWRVMLAGKPPETYHISSPLLWPIRDVVDIVCREMGVYVQDVVRYAEDRPGKDGAYELDDAKLRALGWSDTMTLVAGIRNTVRWVQQNWSELKDQPMEYRL